MDKSKFKSMVKTSAKEHPKKAHSPEYVLSGYWEKKGENDYHRSWVGRCKGVEILEDGKEKIMLDFGSKDKPICFVKQEWLTEKDDPEKKAMFHWHLKDGLYFSRIFENEKAEKPIYSYFAVCDGERTDLSEEAALSILQEQNEDTPA